MKPPWSNTRFVESHGGGIVRSIEDAQASAQIGSPDFLVHMHMWWLRTIACVEETGMDPIRLMVVRLMVGMMSTPGSERIRLHFSTTPKSQRRWVRARSARNPTKTLIRVGEIELE